MGFGVQKRGKKEFKTFLEETYGQNLIHPLAGLIFLSCLIWSFCAPRKYLLWPIIFIACFISPAQRFAVMGLDFHFLRAITVVLLIRIILFRDLKDVRLGLPDLAIIGLVSTIILATLARGGVSPATSIAGKMVEPFGLYFIGRAFVRNLDDVRHLLLGVSLCAIPVGIAFTIEQFTRYNLFAIFGGIPEITAERAGKLRSQGSFVHPIIAGVFWASFAPMYIGQILAKGRGLFSLFTGWIGFVMCCVCALMTNSSTSIAGILIGLCGWCLYKCRRNLRALFWITLTMMAIVHLASTRGIHGVIFTRVSFISASTGYHRYRLFDGFFDNVQSWFLMGTDSRMFNRSFIDVTNQYILTGLDGGIISLFLLLALIVMAFKAIGRALNASVQRQDTMLLFGIGVGYLTAVISFTAVSSNGEGVIPLYLFMGMMISLGDPNIGLKSLRWTKETESKTNKTKYDDLNSGKTPFTGRARG